MPGLSFVVLLYSTSLWAGAAVSDAGESESSALTPEELENYTFEEEPEVVFVVSDLSPVQVQLMASQRLMAKDLLSRKVGAVSFQGRKRDIRVLQQMIDKRSLRSDQIEEWQAMGVLFGDIIANEFSLVWVRYEDRFGISKVLRWRETDNFVFPVPIFSKRVKFHEKINVQAIFDQVALDIERFKAWERKPKLPNARKSG